MDDQKIIGEMLRDEQAFLEHARWQELIAVVRYYNERARDAETPQEREFFHDRAYQFSLHT